MEIPEEYRYAYVAAEIATEVSIVFGLPVVATARTGSGSKMSMPLGRDSQGH